MRASCSITWRNWHAWRNQSGSHPIGFHPTDAEMSQMRMIKLAIAAMTLALFAGSATARPFTQLWIFGDSSVDSGSYKIAPYSGNPHFDVYLVPTTPHGRT